MRIFFSFPGVPLLHENTPSFEPYYSINPLITTGPVFRGKVNQKDDFEQPEERLNDHVEGFSGNGKPFALRTVHQIRG